MIRWRFALATMVSAVLVLAVSASAQGTKLPDTTYPDKTYGEGGTKTISTETRADGVRIENIDVKDKNGTLRERHHRTVARNGQAISNDEWWGPDGKKTREMSATADAAGRVTSMSSATYKNGEQQTGDTWEKKRDDWDHQRFNPKTGKYESTDPTPPPAKTSAELSQELRDMGIAHNFYLGGGFIIEDSFKRFLTYGFEGSYTRALPAAADNHSRFALMADFEWTRGTSDEVTYTKLQGLGGLAFCERARGEMYWGAHVLAGFSRVHSHSDSLFMPSYTGTSFALAAGVDAGKRVNEKLDVQIRADYNPTFQSGNFANNIRVSGGLRYRF